MPGCGADQRRVGLARLGEAAGALVDASRRVASIEGTAAARIALAVARERAQGGGVAIAVPQLGGETVQRLGRLRITRVLLDDGPERGERAVILVERKMGIGFDAQCLGAQFGRACRHLLRREQRSVRIALLEQELGFFERASARRSQRRVLRAQGGDVFLGDAADLHVGRIPTHGHEGGVRIGRIARAEAQLRELEPRSVPVALIVQVDGAFEEALRT